MTDAPKKSFLLSLYDIAQNESKIDEQLCYPLQNEISSTESRYDEPEEFFEGGVKLVQKVYDNINGRYVALATLKEQRDPEALERFYSEARLTSALQHPNIMPIYDLGYDADGLGYFTMKFITGDNLAVILKELKKQNPNYVKQYSLTVLLGIYNKICDAIAYAHANNVLHLDIKPANIQIGDYGEVIVCDWGLGKIVHVGDQDSLQKKSLDGLILNDLTIDGMVKGTPGYMAPEQIDSKIAQKSFYTDIYSLGVILYQILSNKKPVDGTSVRQVLDLTIKGEIVVLSQLSSQLSIPESLEAVCMKALHLDPKKRYQNVTELKREVESYLNGFATEAESATLWQQFKLLAKRNKPVMLAIAGSIVLLVLFTIFFVYQLSENETTSRKLAMTLQLEKVESEKQHELHEKSVERNIRSIKLYRKEKLAKENALDYFFSAARAAYSQNDFETTRLFCKRGLKAFPKNPRLSKLLATCHLTTHWIPVALAVMDNYDFDRKEELIAKLIPLQELRKKNEQHFTRKDLLAYFKVLKEYDFSAVMRRVYYNEPAMTVTDEYLPLLRYMLEYYNPQVNKLKIKVETINGKSKLDLSNNEALEDITALRNLEINILDLSHTLVSSLIDYNNKISLTEIDISHSRIPNLIEIRKMVKLKKLIVHKDQFLPEWFSTYPKYVEVITRQK